MLFTALCTGWILNKRVRTLIVAQTSKTLKLGETKRIYSPLTPDQPPFKGGHYVKFIWEGAWVAFRSCGVPSGDAGRSGAVGGQVGHLTAFRPESSHGLTWLRVKGEPRQSLAW